MNDSNLKPIRSKSEAREKGRKGGFSSGKSRREKRKMRQILTELLERTGDDVEVTKEGLAIALLKKALLGDVRAFETIMRFIGDTPTKDMQERTDKEIRKNPFNLEW